MPVYSMTGFAREQGHLDDASWVWEVKSVNGKSLDVRLRTPSGMDALESKVRALCADRVSRGNVSIGLQMGPETRPVTMQVNQDVLHQLKEIVSEIALEFGAQPPRVDGLLSVRGVIEYVEQSETEDELAAREQAMLDSLISALDSLKQSRLTEGAKLDTVMRQLVEELEGLTEAAGRCESTQPDAIRKRLSEQISRLTESDTVISDERLAQEAAVLATKADITEEIDRLNAHVGAARDLLNNADGGPIGRKLDFLAQEFNREANTLCSKSNDIALTQIGLDMKAAIDRFREQCQNIE